MLDLSNVTDLPAVVPMITMWGAWADQLCNGHKTIETRVWEWTKGPSYLAIHCALQFDDRKAIPTAEREQFGATPWLATRGSLCALVYVHRCRTLVEADRPAALIYRPGLWAFDLDLVARLRGPKRLGSRGKPIGIDRDEVWAARELTS